MLINKKSNLFLVIVLFGSLGAHSSGSKKVRTPSNNGAVTVHHVKNKKNAQTVVVPVTKGGGTGSTKASSTGDLATKANNAWSLALSLIQVSSGTPITYTIDFGETAPSDFESLAPITTTNQHHAALIQMAVNNNQKYFQYCWSNFLLAGEASQFLTLTANTGPSGASTLKTVMQIASACKRSKIVTFLNSLSSAAK